MLKTTKQMRKDMRKIREEDLIVCNKCGSEEVSEKVWIDSNSFVRIDGHQYSRVLDITSDDSYWCDACGVETTPLHIEEYRKGGK